MGRATGRACIISILSFEEYTDDDQMGDGRTTKSVLWKSNKYFKSSRFSYVKVVLCGLKQLVPGLSKDHSINDLVNLEEKEESLGNVCRKIVRADKPFQQQNRESGMAEAASGITKPSFIESGVRSGRVA